MCTVLPGFVHVLMMPQEWWNGNGNGREVGANLTRIFRVIEGLKVGLKSAEGYMDECAEWTRTDCATETGTEVGTEGQRQE